MNQKKPIFLIIFSIVALSLMSSVNAEEYNLRDQKNDVYYLPGGGADTQLDISTQPDIDIVDVKYSTDESTISIIVNVVGSIQSNSQQYLYYGEYTSADAEYQFTFSNNNVNAMIDANGVKGPVDANAQVENDSLTVTFGLATDDRSLIDLYAYGHYYEDSETLMMGPKYIDTTSDIENEDPSETPGGNGNQNNDSTQNNSPGFKIIILIFAVIILLATVKKMKKY